MGSFGVSSHHCHGGDILLTRLLGIVLNLPYQPPQCQLAKQRVQVRFSRYQRDDILSYSIGEFAPAPSH